jgi:carbonic anhydrase/acetyltransferase-like protein (isoleucine patch superfamily)
MHPLTLRTIYAIDRVRFALFRSRWRRGLHLGESVSPNLRLAQLRIGEGGAVHVETGFATERQQGNYLWVEAGGQLELGARTWLRTEHGENRLTVFAGGRITIGRDALLNGAMLHAKREISIGVECRLAFGSRIFDADLHALDRDTPERIEPVRIGDRVWLGADVIVLRGVTIGDDVVVGAGSVVSRDLPSRCVAVGQPARPVRSIEPRTDCG